MGQASPARHPGRLGSRREFSHTIEPSGERATGGCRPGVLAAGGFALTLRLLLAMLRPDMETAKLAQAAADAVDTHELVSLLQQMVRIRSYSAGGEEGTIARFMRDYLITLGLAGCGKTRLLRPGQEDSSGTMRVIHPQEVRMRGDDRQQGAMYSYISPEARVPHDHPLRAIRGLVDDVLRELSPRVEGLYARVGRP